MQENTLEGLFLNPGFISVFVVILITIGNIMIGVSMLPRDKRKTRYRLHKNIYFVVLACFAAHLGINFSQDRNTWFHYAVFVYFLAVIPLSPRSNETLHAILASVGLVLLTALATLNLA